MSGFSRTFSKIGQYMPPVVDSIKYGVLYTWDVANKNSGIGVGSVAPSNYHIPTRTEWITLRTFLGGAGVAGGKLKEAGTTHWNAPNTGAINSYGFSARGSGYRTYLGTQFLGLKTIMNIWLST